MIEKSGNVLGNYAFLFRKTFEKFNNTGLTPEDKEVKDYFDKPLTKGSYGLVKQREKELIELEL